MLVAFWDLHGKILANSIPKGQTVTARYYSEVILKRKTERKTEKDVSQSSPEKCPSFALQCPLSYCLIYSGTYELFQVAVVVPPPIQPRPCPYYFYLFPELKKRLAGNRYETRAALISAVNWYLSSRFALLFAEGIQKLL